MWSTEGHVLWKCPAHAGRHIWSLDVLPFADNGSLRVLSGGGDGALLLIERPDEPQATAKFDFGVGSHACELCKPILFQYV